MSEERIVEALKALRDADRDREAGPHVKARVMQAMVGRRRAAPVWIGVSAALLAAAAATFFLLHARRAEPIPQAPPQTVVAVAPHGGTPEALSAPAPKLRSVRARPRPWVLSEVDTEFYPLMEIAPAFERGQLVRMTVPASTMLDVGLDVDVNHLDDPVQADVLIGQEGMARAIRFVSYEMKEKI